MASGVDMSKARKAKKLLPCPFYGGTDVRTEHDEDGFYRVRCVACGASTSLEPEEQVTDRKVRTGRRR